MTIVRVDERGRVTLPSELRKKLRVGRLVKLEVSEGKIVITPVENPLEKLKGTAGAVVTGEELDELAERLLGREALK